jgi:hypothetical protein
MPGRTLFVPGKSPGHGLLIFFDPGLRQGITENMAEFEFSFSITFIAPIRQIHNLLIPLSFHWKIAVIGPVDIAGGL